MELSVLEQAVARKAVEVAAAVVVAKAEPASPAAPALAAKKPVLPQEAYNAPPHDDYASPPNESPAYSCWGSGFVHFDTVQQALVDFRDATEYHSWVSNKKGWDELESFTTFEHFQKCDGVTIENGAVTEINLASSGLAGRIPETLATIISLEELRLNNNSISGPLPGLIGKLRQLTTLWLQDNKFEGSIPEGLANMISLCQLRLSNNCFSGALPQCIRLLVNLQTVCIDGNEFSGPLPLSLIRQKALGCFMNLSGNKGFFLPTDLGQLGPDIKHLDLSHCSLIGEIPLSIRDLKLDQLHLQGNDLTPPAGLNSFAYTLDSVLGLEYSEPRKVEALYAAMAAERPADQ